MTMASFLVVETVVAADRGPNSHSRRCVRPQRHTERLRP